MGGMQFKLCDFSITGVLHYLSVLRVSVIGLYIKSFVQIHGFAYLFLNIERFVENRDCVLGLFLPRDAMHPRY